MLVGGHVHVAANQDNNAVVGNVNGNGNGNVNAGDFAADNGSEPEAQEESDAEASPCVFRDGEHDIYPYSCKLGLRKFLQQVKGMSEADAKAFVRDHFNHSAENCVAEDGTRLRSVQASVTFKNTVPNKDGDKSVNFSAELHYHSRARIYSYEHCASLTYSVNGPDAKTTARGKVLSCEEHPQITRANHGLPYNHQASFVEARKFSLTQKAARSIQAVCGPGWTVHEAVVFFYAAVGVAYSDRHLQCDGLARPIKKRGWLEHYTRQVCKAAGGKRKSAGKSNRAAKVAREGSEQVPANVGAAVEDPDGDEGNQTDDQNAAAEAAIAEANKAAALDDRDPYGFY